MRELTPQEVVNQLDQYIIGQEEAKKAVAVALRNRYRRRILNDEERSEIFPKNIIMIGSTGVGKTEIARRIARFTGAPFIKVEATKYTEVGYVGRDAESMIRDLMNLAVNLIKNELQNSHKEEIELKVEEAIIELLFPKGSSQESSLSEETYSKMRQRLKSGEFEDKEVEINISHKTPQVLDLGSGMFMEDLQSSFGQIMGGLGLRKDKKRKMSVKKARDVLINQEAEKYIDQEQVIEIAKKRVEEMGIVFIDEIDKIVSSSRSQSSASVSREGVQRDILPIIEGCQVNTKYGIIDTSHILFIAAGAFHSSKPSDLMPELQGRFPIQVKLKDLNKEDFYTILTKPKFSLVRQYTLLLKTEGVILKFDDKALKFIASSAVDINENTSNTGARRLQSLLEIILEDILFRVPESGISEYLIDENYVKTKLSKSLNNNDLSRYIL